ncbi:glycosyl transferase family 1, partial [Halobacteriales archaeon SW_5_68_122]
MHHRATDDLRVDEYDAYLDDGRRREIRETAAGLDDLRVAHVNSTASGGGVAEILDSLVPLLNDAGVETDWLVMEAPEPFFDVTKALHNGLQGEAGELTDSMRDTYRSVTEANAEADLPGYDAVVLH